MGKEEALKFDKWGYPVNTTSNHCISAINDFYEQDEATVYEKAVFDAVSCIISDDTDDDVALEFHFKLLRDFPKDLSSLKRAQILCFYMGQPNPSLDLVQQVLPENEEEAYIYGMLSFPLLELGQMEEAERAARKALEINKQDVWAQHCSKPQHNGTGSIPISLQLGSILCRFIPIKILVCCVYHGDGTSANTFCQCSCAMFFNMNVVSLKLYSSWKIARLHGVPVRHSCHSPVAKVLDVYDHCIMREIDRTDATRPEVYLNALGLLLRLHIRGQISLFEDRLKNLAELLTDKSLWYLEWQLDLFILWALTNTDKLPAAQELLKGLKLRVSNMSDKKQQQFQRGLSLAETIYEYGRGKDERALQLLGSDFDACDYKAIGASDEQIDVFNEVWYILLLNTGKAVKVIDAIEKRLKMRDGVPFLWRLLERAYSMMGREEAVRAADKANHLERIYFQ
uniref:Tetratricopeptide repeat protein 38 n=1 Tax=Chenopodium quinoa TaxID=63459 RepID=A0A803MB19_CHEQI